MFAIPHCKLSEIAFIPSYCNLVTWPSHHLFAECLSLIQLIALLLIPSRFLPTVIVETVTFTVFQCTELFSVFFFHHDTVSRDFQRWIFIDNGSFYSLSLTHGFDLMSSGEYFIFIVSLIIITIRINDNGKLQIKQCSLHIFMLRHRSHLSLAGLLHCTLFSMWQSLRASLIRDIAYWIPWMTRCRCLRLVQSTFALLILIIVIFVADIDFARSILLSSNLISLYSVSFLVGLCHFWVFPHLT